MTEARLELRIGAPVETTDGPLGHIHQVILSPAQRRVTGLVVRTGLLPGRDLMVPAELIADASDERVRLGVSADDVRRQPAFDPAHYLPLAAEDQGYQAGEALASIHGHGWRRRQEAGVARHGALQGHGLALRSGQQVWAIDGRAGRVDRLLLNAGGQVSHFVIHKGRLPGHDVIVPVDWISAISERGVWLAMKREALERLPLYRTDSAIAHDVDQALWADGVIRALDVETIEASVGDGVVTLSGYASTPTSKALAERAVRQVPGVLGVKSEIVTDNDVEVAVAEALASAAPTRGQPIRSHASHGFVKLSGEVDSADVRAAAEEIAAGVADVRGVINHIQAPGVVVEPAQQRPLQPRIEQDVYAEDMFLGRVEQVIVSPRHRRVTAFVLRGRLPDPERAEAYTLPADMPRQERRLVIPIDVVDDVTIGGVLLTIGGVDAARYPDFDPEHFIEPATGWQPPYPYTHADVLLDLGWAALGDHRSAPGGEILAVEPGPEGQPSRQQISRGTPVLFLDGIAGVVDHVWLDPGDGSVSHIIVQAGGPLPKDTAIPLDWVRRIDETGIFVEVATEQLAALPGATPAANVAQAV